MSIFALRSNGLASSAYKNLSRTQSNLNSNIGRLSSGLRINSTADDSAGSNVSVRMGNQVRGMSQASRNTEDANNLLATAESGLSDISDILGKMRELSVQASTDTLNDADRASIDLEFQSLKDELTRIANVTEYNGMNVLNGTYQTAGTASPPNFWEGTNGDNGITVQSSTGNFHGGINVNKQADYGPESEYRVEAHNHDYGFGNEIINVRVGNNQPFDVDINIGNGEMRLSLDPNAFNNPNNNTFFHLAFETSGGSIGDGTSESSETWAGTGPESLFNEGGGGYVGDLSSNEYDQAQPGTSGSINQHGSPDNIRGHWRIQIGADNDINNQHEFSITNATANGLDLEGDNVLSVDNSRTAITAIDHAIDEVNRERSYIGSEQNKLQFTMSNLTSNIQSIESSRSSIEDVDFAAEAADLAKNQILAQSGTAMLAQASAISQNILGLLA